MQERTIGLVTISREFGSGGSDLGHALGARLGWRVIDREVVAEAAARLEVPPDEAAALDEHGLTQWERAVEFIAYGLPETLLPPLPPPRVRIEAFAAVVTAVLQEAAERGPAVIVGHGAQCIFRDRADALHLRVYAPPEHRVREVARRRGVDERDARATVRQADDDRAGYLRHLYDVDWRDPLLYDVQINTARIDPARASAMIAALVRGEGAA